uniref:Odorant receptor n=1 Tax=Locusta migratoria TaxID=7004 RepID=A0A0M4IUF1_LOCMI|nr:odorant receptor 102 [Locusta migratoria]
MEDAAGQSATLLSPCSVALAWLGIWRPPGGRRSGLGLPGAVFIAALDITISSLALVQMLIDRPEDPADFREVFFICSCGVSWSVKVVAFLLQGDRLERMVLSLLDAKTRFPDNGSRVREKYTAMAYTVWRMWQAMPAVTVLLWMADPLLQTIISPPADNATRPLIFWLPVQVHDSPAYEVTYAVEAFFIGTVSETSILMDIFLIILLVYAAGEIAVLNENVARMGLTMQRETAKAQPVESSSEKASMSKTRYVPSGDSPAADVGAGGKGQLPLLDGDDALWDMYSALVTNIRHHQAIIAYINDLEVVLSTSIYILLLTNALNVCLHSFGLVAFVIIVFLQLLAEGATSSTVFKEVISFASFLAQTALFCFFGQLIIDQADRLQFSAFCCDWPDADESFRRSLRIFMARATCPIKVTVGKLVELSRNTFLQALNASYTIFNMLFNLQTSDE